MVKITSERSKYKIHIGTYGNVVWMPKMDYLDWNDLVAQKFFNTEMAGREVLLYVTGETINQLGSEAGEDVNDFINCVKIGPSWATRQGICQKALQCYEDWRGTRQGYPQYIAYLALFVLAATESGYFDPKAYYPKLRRLLGELPKIGTYPSFDKMDRLWDNLERWSKSYKHGELGSFTKRIRGGNVHIGLPLSQTILSDDERKFLPQIFSESEIDPTDPPSELSLSHMLLKYGANKLAKRTLQLLRSDDEINNEIRNALIDFILEELTEWDGSTSETITLDTQHLERIATIRPSSVGLRLCFDPPDLLIKRILFHLRFKANRPFPESGLDFGYRGQIYSCFETVPPKWSTKLKNSDTGDYLNAAEIDWTKGVKFQDKEKSWRANLKAAYVHLFLPGNREGLPGWIESQRLERNCEFILACHSTKADVIWRWGTSSCKEFQMISFQGLPDNWSLFKGHSAHQPCHEVEVLNLPSFLRLRFQGGIRIGRSNSYLVFSPPSVILEGNYGDERIVITSGSYKQDLERDASASPSWTIPPNVPVGEPLDIEVYRCGNDLLEHKVLQVVQPTISIKQEDTPKRDCLGQIVTGEDPENYVRGAIVECVTLPSWESFPQVYPTYLSKRIIFLGSRPGEVTDWPEEDLPKSWKPVWAMAKVPKSGKERWDVHYCGFETQKIFDLNPGDPLNDRRAVKRWAETIRVKRKRIKGPSIRALRLLWAKYMEAANHA